MRVAVLGAGIAGVTTAYALARDGHEVTVIDRQPLAANETSFSNAGMVAPGHAYTWASPRAPMILLKSLWRNDTSLRFKFSTDPRLYTWSLRFLRECNAASAARNTGNKLRLCLYSQAQLQETVAATGIEYDRVTGGAVYLYRDKALFDAGVRNTRVLTDLGLELEAVDPQRAAAIEPALDAVKGRLAGAIYSPSDESGDCHGFANKLAAICAGLGVRFRWSTTIRRIEASADRIEKVVTDQGDVVADAYVMALGCYAPIEARRIGVTLPIYPVKGYALTLKVGGRNGAPRLSGVDEQNLVAWSRLGDRLRLTATAEFAGYDTSHRPADFAHMLSVARGLFPGGADFDDPFYWAGLRPMTPKGTPILGQARHRNLWFNTGLGHMGWTMSHGTARVTADLIAGRAPGVDLTGMRLADA
ncbi:MAG: D-amino acid dehydrogenase [Alphaproteobacteria bacterium]|nr:D-amino acid dehydrogenase [Alphaproteobacteria bacterium]